MYTKSLDREVSKFIDPLIALTVDARPPTPLESKTHFQKRLKKSLLNTIHNLQERLANAVELLKKENLWPKDERLEKAKAIFAQPKLLEKELTENKTLQEMMQITNKEMGQIYEIGWRFLHQGSFHDASDIFLLLAQMNPRVAAFWSAFGNSEEKQENYQQAMIVFLLAAELEEQTLIPYLHGVKCLLKLHRHEDAQRVLQRALERVEENPKFKPFKETIKQMLQAIR